MNEPNDAAGGAPGTRAVPEGDQAPPTGPVCQVAWCPFCLAVGAVQPIKPEMVEHLLKAGTELMLAFRTVLETRTDAASESDEASSAGRTRLEKIDLG